MFGYRGGNVDGEHLEVAGQKKMLIWWVCKEHKCMLEHRQEDPETITTYEFECDDDDFYVQKDPSAADLRATQRASNFLVAQVVSACLC
eukprot:COSAG03_NODE_25450_length_265_cov_0.939759_1_plen_88_part_11